MRLCPLLLLATGCADILGVDFDGLRHEDDGDGGSDGGAAGMSAGSAGAGGAGSGGRSVLVPGERRVADLAVDESDVFFVDRSPDAPEQGVWRVPKAGGEAVRLVERADVQRIVVDATHAYYTTDYIIFKVPKGGGEESQVAQSDGLDHIQGLALFGGVLYWTTTYSPSVEGRISKIGVDGLGFEELADTGSGSGPYGIAVDATHIHFTYQTGTLLRMPIGGGPTEERAGGLSEPADLAANDTHLCWSELEVLSAVPKAGGAPAWLSIFDIPEGVAASATHCYFAHPTGVLRAPLDMSISAVVQPIANVHDVAFDAAEGRLFFTAETDEGAVFSAPP